MNADDKKLYPLTHPQRRILHMEMMHSGTPIGNIGGPVRFAGMLQLDILEQAISNFVQEHEGVRLQITEDAGEYMQYTEPYRTYPLGRLDFSTYTDPKKQWEMWVNKEAAKPFKLLNHPLYSFSLFKIGDHEYGYLAKFHHIIADGWSMQLMTDAIAENYLRLMGVESAHTSYNPESYLEYVRQEQAYLTSSRCEKNRHFWLEKFSTIDQHVPVTLADCSSTQTTAHRRSYELSRSLSLLLRQAAKQHQCSLQTLITTFFCILINKTTGCSDIIISIPVINRSGVRQKKTFGMFTSTMPFRVTIPEQTTFRTLLDQIQEDLRKSYYHQKYPYDLLAQDLASKDRAMGPLYELSVNCYNTRLQTETNGIPVYNEQFHNGHQTYSLQLVVKDWSHDDSLSLDFDYKIEEYEEAKIHKLYEQLIIIMEQLLVSPDLQTSLLNLFAEGEREQLLCTYNSTETEYPNYTVQELFERQTQYTPFKIALSNGLQNMTYQELNQKTNQLASYLASNGIGKGHVIALYMDHSFWTVIGILGILKTGAAYLPLEVSDPTDRIEYMLLDANCRLLLTDHERIQMSSRVPTQCIEEILLHEVDTCRIAKKIELDDPAYVIYTSGSTGKPKGTLVGHRSLTNYIWWAKKMYVKSEHEVFALFTSLAFDLTITSIFTPLISGGSIQLYPILIGDQSILKIIADNQVTVLKLTPAHLSLIYQQRLSNTSLKRFIVGGEELKSGLCQEICRLFDSTIEIFNEYGPTEATVGCMSSQYSPDHVKRRGVPIGKPADNVQIFLLDDKLEPVPPYVPGEIYIAGVGLSLGYLNRPELNKEKFLAHPFISGQKIYKTGDRGRFLGSGEMEYLGRKEEYIKHNGYRIELAEVDSVLLSCEGVIQAVTLQLQGKAGHNYLCSFVVAEPGLTDKSVKLQLAMSLPQYMNPSVVHLVEKLPLNRNGKIDRKGLALLQADRAVLQKRFLPPRNEKEAILLQTISQVLQMKDIGIGHNFYQLGGDSITAIQMISLLQQGGYQLKVSEVMANPVIEDMARLLQKKATPTVESVVSEGRVRNTPIVAWFWQQMFEFPQHLNQNVILKIENHVSNIWLEQIWREIVNHHDSLRLYWDEDNKQLRYSPLYEHSQAIFTVCDLTTFPEGRREQEFSNLIQSINISFDLTKGPLAKACLMECSHDDRYLLLAAHHLVVDGLSWRIILEDMYTALSSMEREKMPVLPKKTVSYQQWAARLLDYEGKSEIDHWKQFRLEHSSKSLLAKTGAEEDLLGREWDTMVIALEEELTSALLTTANKAYGTQTRDLLMTGLFLTMFNHWDIQKAVIELEGHGREELFSDLDLSRSVGWFTSLYPFSWSARGNHLSSHIKSMKEQIRSIPNNGIGYGILRYVTHELENEKPLSIRFNYLGELLSSGDTPYWKVVAFSGFSKSDDPVNGVSPHNHLTTELELKCIVIQQQLRIAASYSKRSWNAGEVMDFLEGFQYQLHQIAYHCCNQHEVEYTPSDFDAALLTEEDLNTLFR